MQESKDRNIYILPIDKFRVLSTSLAWSGKAMDERCAHSCLLEITPEDFV